MTFGQDSTDYRSVIERSFDNTCPFCDYYVHGDKPAENELAFVKPDARPVTPGHSLIIPKRHTVDWFGTTRIEQEAMNDLLRARRAQLMEADPTIEGFNIGMNVGEVAGQTIFHCHFHLIPRRKGDGGRMKGVLRGIGKTGVRAALHREDAGYASRSRARSKKYHDVFERCETMRTR